MPPASCPSCDERIAPGANYCGGCGRPVEADPRAAEPSSVERTPTSDARTLAALTHILGLFTWVLGPLVVLIVSDDPFVVRNAKNATMWQLMVMVYGIVSIILIIFVVGLLLLVLLGLLDIIFCIVAAVKASDGEAWGYPLTPRA